MKVHGPLYKAQLNPVDYTNSQFCPCPRIPSYTIHPLPSRRLVGTNSYKTWPFIPKTLKPEPYRRAQKEDVGSNELRREERRTDSKHKRAMQHKMINRFLAIPAWNTHIGKGFEVIQGQFYLSGQANKNALTLKRGQLISRWL